MDSLYNDGVDPFRDDQSALQVRVEELEEELALAREDLARAEESQDAIKKTLATYTRVEKEQKTEIQALQAELASLRDKIQAAGRDLAETRAERRKLDRKRKPEKKKKDVRIAYAGVMFFFVAYAVVLISHRC